MSFIRTLTGTDISVSALGLGTVKLGRDQQVKYPDAFSIPDDKAVKNLLSLAYELGINFLDTAPAYGRSEERLGALLQNRDDWVICTKVGEEFEQGKSHFDFSADHTRFSIERSLRRLKTDYLDLVLIHSDGNDDDIINDGACIETLKELQQQGLIKAIGMSTKTISGGIAAVENLDVVMLTYNLQQQDQEVLAAAQQLGKGVLVKKGLMSGHVLASGGDLVAESMKLIFANQGVGSMISGTINPEHLRNNVAMVKTILEENEQA